MACDNGFWRTDYSINADGCYIAELSHRRDVEEPLYKVCEYMERIGNLYETPNLLQEVRS